MFRHEDKFHKPPAFAVKIPASLADDEAMAKLEKINQAVFTRVGDELAVRMAAVEIEGSQAGIRYQRFAAKAGSVSDRKDSDAEAAEFGVTKNRPCEADQWQGGYSLHPGH